VGEEGSAASIYIGELYEGEESRLQGLIIHTASSHNYNVWITT
jgi:hypothetical protein